MNSFERVKPLNYQSNLLLQLYESESAKEVTLNTIPMRRLGQPDEIGGVVAFLVSEDASYITGECIVVAGGCNSRL